VFCASLADVFDNQVDPAWRADLFDLIRECDQLDWQLLTKRPQNIRKMLPSDWGDGYPNVWLGTTTEDAQAYKQRASFLLKVPAAIRFVSYEPAIGPLGRLDLDGRSPDWVDAVEKVRKCLVAIFSKGSAAEFPRRLIWHPGRCRSRL